MGNRITNDAAGLSLKLNNGGTSVLLSVLLLAGSDLAQSEWERELMTWFAGHDQAIFGLGVVGFDVHEIAWTRAGLQEQKAFVLKMIELALTRHRWDALGYDPPYAHEYLATLRKLIEAVTRDSIRPDTNWQSQARPEVLAKCARHEVYVHAWGCLICNDGPWETPSAAAP
jgi:hypothetical protein